MLLKSLIKELVDIELANYSIGKPQWSDAKFSYQAMINAFSTAYQELHKRFPLKKEVITVMPMEDINEYILTLDYAESNTSSVEPKYIIDGEGTPFSGNVGKIDAIFDQDKCSVSFNTTNLNNCVTLIAHNAFRLTTPSDYVYLTVHLRQVPPSLVVTEDNFEAFDINLPYQYREALMLYAAGRLTSNRGAENASNNESAIFFARFEASCANVIVLGLDDKEEMTNDKLCQRGFV